MTNGTHGGIQIRGSIPAIVTPMHEDGSLDLPAFRKLIDWHAELRLIERDTLNSFKESAIRTPSVHRKMAILSASREASDVKREHLEVA